MPNVADTGVGTGCKLIRASGLHEYVWIGLSRHNIGANSSNSPKLLSVSLLCLICSVNDISKIGISATYILINRTLVIDIYYIHIYIVLGHGSMRLHQAKDVYLRIQNLHFILLGLHQKGK